jgi:hypothetical protein
MPEPVIAIIFDCDDTLCPDTTTRLVEHYGLDASEFWREVNRRVQGDDWDPPNAYIDLILEYVRRGPMEDLTQARLREIGAGITPFPGVPDLFDDLHGLVADDAALREARVRLEFYLLSGGLDDVVRGTGLERHMKGVFACRLAFDGAGRPSGVRSTVTFTEKTRFVFGINKGLTEEDMRHDPYRVNSSIDPAKRRIPMDRMIYLGDGPSDIPCLSLIGHHGGTGIGVSPPASTFRKGFEMAGGRRTTAGPYTADYRAGTDLRKAVEEAIRRIGARIRHQADGEFTDAPRH